MAASPIKQLIPGEVATLHAEIAKLQVRNTPSEQQRWLTPGELETLSTLRDPGRRAAWFLGRWCAKQLILACLRNGTSHWKQRHRLLPTDIQIDSRDGLGRAVGPRITIGGRTQNWSLSITHSVHSVFVAFSRRAGISVGVDVVSILDVRSEALKLWLTAAEQERVSAESSSTSAATIWALKEAIYKSINRGERFFPGQIEVLPDGSGEYRCRVREQERTDFGLEVEVTDHEVLAVAMTGVGSLSQVA